MIDGIDYYPKKNKGNNKFKLWALFLLVASVAAYWYFDNKQSPKKPNSTLILINKPEIKDIVNTIPITIKPSKIKIKKPDILENLDEVMQTYNRENP